MFYTVFLIALAVFLFYRHMRRHYSMFARDGVPGPVPSFFVGNLAEFADKDSLGTFYRLSKRYGKVFGYYEGFTPSIVVSDPAMIELILVKHFKQFHLRPKILPVEQGPESLSLHALNGPAWKRTRAVIASGLRTDSVRKMWPRLQTAVAHYMDGLERMMNDNSDGFDVSVLNQDYALWSFTSAAFNRHRESFTAEDADVLHHYVRTNQKVSSPENLSYVACRLFPPIAPFLKFFDTFHKQKATEFFDFISRKLHSEQTELEDSETPTNFLQHCLVTRTIGHGRSKNQAANVTPSPTTATIDNNNTTMATTGSIATKGVTTATERNNTTTTTTTTAASITYADNSTTTTTTTNDARTVTGPTASSITTTNNNTTATTTTTTTSAIITSTSTYTTNNNTTTTTNDTRAVTSPTTSNIATNNNADNDATTTTATTTTTTCNYTNNSTTTTANDAKTVTNPTASNIPTATTSTNNNGSTATAATTTATAATISNPTSITYTNDSTATTPHGTRTVTSLTTCNITTTNNNNDTTTATTTAATTTTTTIPTPIPSSTTTNTKTATSLTTRNITTATTTTNNDDSVTTATTTTTNNDDSITTATTTTNNNDDSITRATTTNNNNDDSITTATPTTTTNNNDDSITTATPTTTNNNDDRITTATTTNNNSTATTTTTTTATTITAATTNDDTTTSSKRGPAAKASSSSTLTEPEVLGVLSSLFGGGLGPTATTMDFVLYCLALHPEEQERLREEVIGVCGEQEPIKMDHIRSMEYLDMFVCETFRLYPVAPGVARICVEDCVLEGVQFRKGTVIRLMSSSQYRDAEVFPDPERFDPERFSKAERKKRHPYSFLPFGSGPRMCVAMRLGQLMAKLALASVVRRFRVLTCARTLTPLPLAFRPFLCPRDGVCVRLEPRDAAVV